MTCGKCNMATADGICAMSGDIIMDFYTEHDCRLTEDYKEAIQEDEVP